jgi:hypothetical protein
MSTSSNLIDIRMKLSGGKAVVSGLTGTRKETEKLGSATKKTSTLAEKAEKTTGKLSTAYGKLGSNAKWAFGLVGAGALFEIDNGIHATEELSKTTTGLTRNLGFSTKAASEWGAVAQAREIDTKSLNMAFGTLSTKMVEAGRKGGTLLTPFHQLGISQEEVSKGAHNFQWGLNRVVTALGEEEGGTKRATAAKAVLGRGYQTLLPLFSRGSEGLKEQLHWADEFGVTLNGKTNKGLEEMIEAQRKNKVAMLGLQVSMTKFLQPAINAGDEQLQEFIKTLNSPHLTAEEKIEKIGRQFEGLEGDVIKVIEKALPSIAEHAGQMGGKIAGAVWHGFVHSDLLGKAVIAGYVLHLFGGGSLVKKAAAEAGGRLATSLGKRFLAVVAPYFGIELAEAAAAEGTAAAGGAAAGTAGGVAAGGGGAAAAGGLAVGGPLAVAGGAVLLGHLSTTQAGEEFLGARSPAEERRAYRRHLRERHATAGAERRLRHQSESPLGVPLLPGQLGTSPTLIGPAISGPPAPSSTSGMKPFADAIGRSVGEHTERALRNTPLQVTVAPILDGKSLAESTEKHAKRRSARKGRTP